MERGVFMDKSVQNRGLSTEMGFWVDSGGKMSGHPQKGLLILEKKVFKG